MIVLPKSHEWLQSFMQSLPWEVLCFEPMCVALQRCLKLNQRPQCMMENFEMPSGHIGNFGPSMACQMCAGSRSKALHNTMMKSLPNMLGGRLYIFWRLCNAIHSQSPHQTAHGRDWIISFSFHADISHFHLQSGVAISTSSRAGGGGGGGGEGGCQENALLAFSCYEPSFTYTFQAQCRTSS